MLNEIQEYKEYTYDLEKEDLTERMGYIPLVKGLSGLAKALVIVARKLMSDYKKELGEEGLSWYEILKHPLQGTSSSSENQAPTYMQLLKAELETYAYSVDSSRKRYAHEIPPERISMRYREGWVHKYAKALEKANGTKEMKQDEDGKIVTMLQTKEKFMDYSSFKTINKRNSLYEFHWDTIIAEALSYGSLLPLSRYYLVSKKGLLDNLKIMKDNKKDGKKLSAAQTDAFLKTLAAILLKNYFYDNSEEAKYAFFKESEESVYSKSIFFRNYEICNWISLKNRGAKSLRHPGRLISGLLEHIYLCQNGKYEKVFRFSPIYVSKNEKNHPPKKVCILRKFLRDYACDILSIEEFAERYNDCFTTDGAFSKELFSKKHKEWTFFSDMGLEPMREQEMKPYAKEENE